jgi:membrane-bound ClpP family serine protease
MPFDMRDVLVGLILIIFGILCIVIPAFIDWLVGIAFIIVGAVRLLPASEKK